MGANDVSGLLLPVATSLTYNLGAEKVMVAGAPWTKEAKRGEVGGTVIIGGHKKKAQKVLFHLRRMFMPLQNYKELELDFLENYWLRDKDVLGVTHFGDLVPEVMYFGEENPNQNF